MQPAARVWVSGPRKCSCLTQETRRGAKLLGIAFRPAYVLANCVSNAVNALATRHLAAFHHPIEALPNPPYIYSTCVAREMGAYYDQALRQGSWRTGKTLVKQRQVEESIAMDFPNYSRVKAHIKTEVVLTWPKKARLIQAFVRLRDNYEFADQYRAFTAALVEWTHIPRVYFGTKVDLRSACGLNHEAIAKQVSAWLEEYPQAARTIFVDDLTNMDGSVQNAHLQPHYELYSALDPLLAMHSRASHLFKGTITAQESTVFYKGEATVQSGAQDTSSGQTCRRIDTFVRCLYGTGVTHIIGFAFGDDLWVIMGGVVPPLEQMAQLQAKCGWKAKGMYVGRPEQSDFLGCTFVPDEAGGYAMLPMIGRLLTKLFWTWRVVPPRRQASYIRQVAEGFYPRFQSLRFMASYLQHHMAVPEDKPFFWARPPAQDVHPVKLCWPEFFHNRYCLGMPPESLIQLIQALPKASSALVSDPWAESVIEYDLADPAERQNI